MAYSSPAPSTTIQLDLQDTGPLRAFLSCSSKGVSSPQKNCHNNSSTVTCVQVVWWPLVGTKACVRVEHGEETPLLIRLLIMAHRQHPRHTCLPLWSLPQTLHTICSRGEAFGPTLCSSAHAMCSPNKCTRRLHCGPPLTHQMPEA